ncbi:hypothetical protein FQZ97_1044730 [compost metagenome]
MSTHSPGLGDEFEAWQFLDQLARDLGSFTDQHQHVGVAQTDRQLADALDGVGEYLGRVRLQLFSAFQLSNRVLVVVKNHNVHGPIVPAPSEPAALWPQAARVMDACSSAARRSSSAQTSLIGPDMTRRMSGRFTGRASA